MRATTAWRYAWISGCSLAAMALSGVILQSQYSLYLAFNPSIFLQQSWALLAGIVGMSLIGALLDGGRDGRGRSRCPSTAAEHGFRGPVPDLAPLLGNDARAGLRVQGRPAARLAGIGCTGRMAAVAKFAMANGGSRLSGHVGGLCVATGHASVSVRSRQTHPHPRPGAPRAAGQAAGAVGHSG